MKKTILISALAAGLCVLATPSQLGAATNLLSNGGFEAEPNWNGGVSQDGGYTALTGNQVPGWTIEPGHAVTIHVSPGPYLVISNAYSANMDGEGYNGHNANLYQDFVTSSNASYTFSFDWQSWGYVDPPTANALKVSLTDMVTSNVLYAGLYYYDGGNPHPVHHVSADFSGTGHAVRLRIEESPESGYNDNTFMVDNFDVETGSPQLVIDRATPFQVALSWPTNADGFTLETTLSLPAVSWDVLTNVPVVLGTDFITTVPATNTQQYFRLHRP